MTEQVTEARLCVVCDRRELQPTEGQTCIHCLGKARQDLATILELAAELQDQAVNGRSNPLDAIGRAAPGSRIPGGDALVMLGPGSDGMSAVRDIAAGGAGAWADDERGSDPVPPEWALARVEDDWRRQLGLPAAVSTSLEQAARFVAEHLGWAAQHHPGWPEHAAELGSVRSRLEQVTGAGDRPAAGRVPCFDCGGDLTRQYRQGAPCPHVRVLAAGVDPPGLSAGSGTWDTPWTVPAPRDADTGARWQPCGCDQGGLAASWECRSCHRTYSDAEYWLAVRAAIEEQAS